MKNSISLFLLAFVFGSCEKTVDLDYKDNPSRVIIEGNITNQAGPYFVKITRSIPLAEAGAYPAIGNATVTVSDDAGNSEMLTHTGNGIYRSATLTGVEGRTYTLTVVADGETYTAHSTMPARVPFDSIKVEAVTTMGETEYNLIPVYRDPVAKGNNYRFELSVNNQFINMHFVQNDEVKNGVVNTLRLEINDDDLKLKPGDQVRVKMQCIDKKVSLFYTALALMADSGPGGGTTPNNPPNNISNGALGVFSAHTVETKNATIP